MSTLKVDAIRHNSATSDAITTAADGTCTAKITGMTGGGGLSHRNKIINGAMTVSQRHGTTVVTGVNSTGYRIDRWTHQMASVNSAFSVSQSTDSPDGFSNSYKIDVTTADTSLAAAHAHFFRQKIEGQNLQDFAKGTSSAKQFALSFYVKTNKTGVYTVELYDVDNNRAISKTFTVADSNWNRYTIIFPADTTGAFDNDNGNSLVVQFFLSAGSNYTNNGTFNNSAWGSLSGKSRVSSSNVNFADSTSNNWYITGVQLEVGDTATSFEHRSYGEELRRCYRYFQRRTSSDNYQWVSLVSFYTGSEIHGFFDHYETMRASPTLSADTGSNTLAVQRAGGSVAWSTGIIKNGGDSNVTYYYRDGVSLGTSGQCGRCLTWTAGCNITLSAEL
tara:strand:- start:24 stop:1193 length:1170 start_codon:yes stop_codon:yes gene_type:complete